MPSRPPARRFVALSGVLLLVAGVAVAIVLLLLAPRYHDRQIEQFARGVVGCTTPLVFTEAGTYYLYEEVSGPEDVASENCPADPQPGSFDVELRRAGEPVELTDDDSVGYDSDGMIGTSIGRFAVTDPGTFEMTVTGADAATLAAVGPDPGAIQDSYRNWALFVGIAGVVAGLALVVGSGAGRGRQVVVPAELPSAPERPASPWAPPLPDDRREPRDG